MTTGRQRRQKDREKRAAARRLPPVRSHGGRKLQTGGRPRAVRMVGVGQFADGVARRSARGRQTHGMRRVGSVVSGALLTLVLVLWIVARLAHHL